MSNTDEAIVKNKENSSPYFLIEKPMRNFLKTVLPTREHVLRRLIHLYVEDNFTVQESIFRVVGELVSVWCGFGVVTKLKTAVKNDVTKFYSEYSSIKRNRFKKNLKRQELRASKFKSTLLQLFDISARDALEKIACENAKEFLKCHKNISGNIKRIEALSKKIRLGVALIKKPEAANIPKAIGKSTSDINATKNIECARTTKESNSKFDSEHEPFQKKKIVETKSGRKVEIVNANVTSAIDRCGISNRNAMMVMSATLDAAGHDITNYNLSASTIRKRRHKHRCAISSNVKDCFDFGDHVLTIHYDEKKMKDCTGGTDRQNTMVNRLAIAISCESGCKLLAIPKISDGRGETIAGSIIEVLEDWRIKDKVKAICFDTTSANTGSQNGSAFILERKLEKELLFYACRHHVSELLLKKAFELTIEATSSGPSITIFQRFQDVWPNMKTDFVKINQNCAVHDTRIQHNFPEHIRKELVQFATKYLNTYHSRADYEDFAHMVLLFLGESPLNRKGTFLKIKVPGAVSRARFMGKAIYCLKIYLFRDQFHLTGRELKGLQDLNVFIVTIYMNYWFRCPLATAAPMLDLELINNLIEYDSINHAIAKGVLGVFSRHLWYLSETLIGFAFFDRNVSNETKRLMVAALGKRGNGECSKKANVIVDSINVSELNIERFVTSNTMKFFEVLFSNLSDINYKQLLESDPSCWIDNENFVRAEAIVEKIIVVNDTAERAIHLATKFNEKVTTSETEKQMVFQVVEAHQKQFPYAASKNDTIKNLKKKNKVCQTTYTRPHMSAST